MHIYRASEIGGCIKRNVAGRLGVKPMEPPAAAMTMFERGNAHEEACVAVMESQGWIITDQQKELVLPINDDCQVMGHIDGMVSLPGDINGVFLGEIKSPISWQLFLDNQYNPDPPFLISRYLWQLSCYMVGTQREALLITLDDYKVKYHGIELPPYSREDIVARVLDFESQARAGLPKDCSVREYPCPYYFLHEDEIGDNEDPFDVELHSIATTYETARREASQAKAKLDGLMENREHYWNTNVRVTKSKATRRNTDYKRMAADYGIDVSAYVSTSQYESVKVTLRGDSDGED
jgi:hypothetical protein